jgi:hypothetical protein
MKVISKKEQYFTTQTNDNIGIDSINSLKEFCYKVKDIHILGKNDINWIKSHKSQVLELHNKLLLIRDAGDAVCNLELIGENYFGDLDSI